MKLELDDETGRIIREVYALTAKLEGMYPGRHFTPDGHMVGSLGEVAAARIYGLELFEASNPVHDARTKDGRLVQVKATQGNRIAISDEPQYLIVLKLNPDGTFDEVYNGPGSPVWACAGKLQKTGQRHVSLSTLAKLAGKVEPSERIAKAQWRYSKDLGMISLNHALLSKLTTDDFLVVHSQMREDLRDYYAKLEAGE